MKKCAIALTIAVLAATACSRRVVEESVDTLTATGWNRYRMGEYALAIEAFTAVIDAIPESDPRHLAALYGLATTWNLRMPVGDQDKDEARRLYDRIIELAPASDLAGWCLLGKARMIHLVPVGQEPDYDAVREAYAETYRRFPEAHPGHEAFIYMEAARLVQWTPQATRESAAALKQFIAQHPTSDLLGAAYGLLATCHEILEQPRERLDAMVLSATNRVVDPDSPVQENSWLYWQIATVAEFEVGDFETARHYYRQLLDEYPQDIRRYGAEKALRRMDALEAKLRAELKNDGEA
ncbi:MAG: tetratricopeptide repeat protein [Kiritimatiellia bacterium]|jgi:tetratricopeptide (TPR) repeat protein|nr:tetratricopeptide repeat protein [Kiritimatiellia bacterium]MDP6630604.1 tetratricopeptide repeat protein [Kiritimatiellia bacterium]MDP6811309.1 tetratricopeptide repeat protein [Kiritimatiellia bacterium]MDP7024615.1 tetratricopeptide repeat protein [Kiritimatiellia bacterium]